MAIIEHSIRREEEVTTKAPPVGRSLVNERALSYFMHGTRESMYRRFMIVLKKKITEIGKKKLSTKIIS